jgi:haloalkane dehalogenase
MKLHVEESGSGVPLLWIHGFPLSSAIYSRQMSIEGIHHIVPDLPGFGRSSVPRDFDFSFDSLGHFLDRLVEAIQITQPFNLVTHDFGGAFGMAWAVQHPEKARRIVVINHPFFVADYRWHIWARIWRTPILGELSLLSMNWPAFHRIMHHDSRLLTRDTIRRMYLFLTPEWKHMVLRLYRAAAPAALRMWEPRMRQLTARVPVLVLWGNHDPAIPIWVAERFGAQKVVHFPESGHWPPAEVPDRVAAEIQDFVGL